MKPKLIFLDIDGTLTIPGSNVPPESALEAIRQAQTNGHKIFLCTGRNLAMLRPLMKYSFAGAVASAGGYIFSGEEVLYDCPMDRDDLRTAMELMKENSIFRTVEARDGTWCDEGMGEFLSRRNQGSSELLRWRKTLEQNLGFRPMREYDGSLIYKIVFMCEEEKQLAPVRRALEDKFHFVIQDAFSQNCLNGEMINRSFNKGKGIRIAAEALGFDLADTIGIGDSMNDVEMIETVGYSVCMENGNPALKVKANYVCPAVDQDGLAAAFRKINLI